MRIDNARPDGHRPYPVQRSRSTAIRPLQPRPMKVQPGAALDLAGR
jgi:hypothetical protein